MNILPVEHPGSNCAKATSNLTLEESRGLSLGSDSSFVTGNPSGSPVPLTQPHYSQSHTSEQIKRRQLSNRRAATAEIPRILATCRVVYGKHGSDERHSICQLKTQTENDATQPCDQSTINTQTFKSGQKDSVLEEGQEKELFKTPLHIERATEMTKSGTFVTC